MNRAVALLPIPLLLFAAACGPTVPPIPFDDGGPGVTPDAAPPTPVFPDAGYEAGPPAEAGSCDPADMLIVLDRSDSMTSSVGTQGSRISLAISAIDTITKSPTDTSLRFGLQVLPAIGGAECSTQLVVPLGLGNGHAIQSALGAMSPQLDYGTPIGDAFAAVKTTLAASKQNGRKQYVLLITDGGECCSCGTTDNDIALAQQLHAAGVETFVVGFGGDDDPVLLNNLACAGHTATNFATDCTCQGDACALSSSVSSTTTQLYFKATDGAALQKALASIANQTCCGCDVPVN